MDQGNNDKIESEDIEPETETKKEKSKKVHKKGIIYLSTIPPYMNVTRIRECFEQYGEIGRIFLQPADTNKNDNGTLKTVPTKKKRKKVAKRFTEGWVEFEKKSVAKRVAAFLNNTQVSSKKASKQYDYIWSMKYLPHFKWIHLNERLAYEKAVRQQKLRIEIAQAKKQANFFNSNLVKSKKPPKTSTFENTNKIQFKEVKSVENQSLDNEREKFLKDLFS